MADHFQDDFPDIDFQGGYSGSTQDDSPEEDAVWVGDNSAGDSSSYRRIPASSCKVLAADDTSSSADDKEFATRPKRCDCSRPGATTNSIPTRPIPTVGCSR